MWNTGGNTSGGAGEVGRIKDEQGRWEFRRETHAKGRGMVGRTTEEGGWEFRRENTRKGVRGGTNNRRKDGRIDAFIRKINSPSK